MKSRLHAAVFAFFFSTFGINNFYTKHTTLGIVDILVSVLLCWTFVAPVIVSILNVVRGCQYLWCDSDEEFNRKYVKQETAA